MHIQALLILILVQFIFFIPAAAQEDERPVAPFIRFVTVDTASNNTHIYWNESPSTNVEKYVIYEESTLGGVVIDSVNAPANHYIHVNSNAGSNAVIYSVAAKDSTGNISTRESYNKHSTVFLSAKYDSCNSRMILKWNKYKGWGDSISGYRIFKSVNSMDFELLTGLSNDTVYIDNGYLEQGISENMHYKYFVITIKNDGLESVSNVYGKYTYMPGPPESITAEYASVISKNLVQLSFSIVDTSSINNYALIRSSDKNTGFQRIRQFSGIAGQSLIIHDTIITERDIFYYKLSALNSCNKIIKESNLAVNILLQGSHSENQITLSWNPYENFIQDIQEYNIYRKESDEEFIQIGTNSRNNTEFTDNISFFSESPIPGVLTYKIAAIETNSENAAFSNELTIFLESEIYLPDAFTPDGDGINDIFKPVMNFIPEEFTMLIYNRNGIRIFQTNDPELGWDGTINGRKAPEGVYMYYVEYRSYNGIRKSLKPGTFTLFYPQ